MRRTTQKGLSLSCLVGALICCLAGIWIEFPKTFFIFIWGMLVMGAYWWVPSDKMPSRHGDETVMGRGKGKYNCNDEDSD